MKYYNHFFFFFTLQATETLFRMAVWRGWVKPIKYGQIIIFTLSVSSLLYIFRSDSSAKDSMFSLLRYAKKKKDLIIVRFLSDNKISSGLI